MRYESLKKHGEQWVKIRPALQVYDSSTVLRDTIEDAWWLSDISHENNCAQLRSRDTHHTRLIGLDQIHAYMDDPEGARHGEGPTGILQLNVQLLLFEDKLLAEPIAPPGTSLRHFVPARTRDTLYSAAARNASQTRLAKKRQEFAWSQAGVTAADQAFFDIQAALKELEADLRSRGLGIDMVTKRHHWTLLLGAVGWWVSFTWQRVAANTITDAKLTVSKWSSHPPFPGVLLFEDHERRRLTTDQYKFDLVSEAEARWISWGNPAKSYTSHDLAAKVLTDLLERPNLKPGLYSE